MSYEITEHSYKQAKKLGVQIKPSTNAKKKIDVYKGAEKIASVGATGYKDYGVYLKTDGKAVADKKRDAYKARHAKDRQVVGSPGYWADRLLW